MAGADRVRPLTVLGLTLRLREGWRSAGIAVGAGLAVGLAMALADATVFRAVVPDSQRLLAGTVPLFARLALFLRGALQDEVLLRLIGLTAVLGGLVALRGRRSARVDALAALLVAALLWPLHARGYLAGLDWTALTAARELVLHVGAGTVWGWLYCRHGWLAALGGHASAHLVLQPLLPLLG
ncbi:hypothetical protein ACFOON_16160 [Novosphingobium piscinae]|uniref:CPBP family intramembrane metalloprotease n=1 Tax=Novosphingobium piscinae TaxID=1507448 RepID=A0A7X1FX13_9SPHN|nr:hypothetical protein [Novosphingobium piscinae]MBC2668570.1 hypothetical protein [Novosphingobium piscinae]